MKNARPQTSEASALDKCNSNSIGRFSGTDNPRHLRGLHALRTRSQRREHLDLIAGCSNSPELVAELRRRGLDLPCQLVQDIDRDGREQDRGNDADAAPVDVHALAAVTHDRRIGVTVGAASDAAQAAPEED